jgi:hypothetical protein
MTVTIELSPDREAAFRAQAQALGLSVEEWLLSLADQAGPVHQEEHQRETRPIWEVIAENMKDVPQEDLALLPRDGASQIDHYLYGAPKRSE